MGIFDGLSKPNIKKLERDGNIDGLMDALNHKDLSIRRKAATALGRLGNPSAVDSLIKVLKDRTLITGQYLYLLGDVAKALGEIGDERAEQHLKHAAETEYSASGGFTSFEDMARQASEMKQQIDYFKGAAKEALFKIRAKRN